MSDENAIELSKYRFEKAKECLKSAVALKNIEDYRGAL